MSDGTLAVKPPQSDPFGVPAEEKPGIRVLIIDYDRAAREAVNAAIRQDGYSTTAVGCSTEAVRTLGRADFDIVLTELAVLASNECDVLRTARQNPRDPIIVAVTENTASAGSQAIRSGAWDYLLKPFSTPQLRLVIGRAARAVLQTRTVRALRAEVDRLARRRERSAIIGTSEALTRAIAQARQVAPTTAPVLIIGERGTGKNLLVRYIHQQSLRVGGPCVTVNCALPASLLEVEIFGSREDGNEADERSEGLLATAQGGTLFLDDLAAMPHEIQEQLAGILRDQHGGDDALDVRFVSTISCDPDEAVRAGILREDLLNELGVARVRVPPLRERREDIALLAAHFLSTAWLRHRVAGVAAPRLSMRSVHFLRSLPWRGNVRELRNTIEHIAVNAEPNQLVEPEHIPVAEQASIESAGFDPSVANDALREAYHTAKDRLLNEFERVYFRRLVDTTEGNLARAARIASIDRTTLYRLIEKHKIDTRRRA